MLLRRHHKKTIELTDVENLELEDSAETKIIELEKNDKEIKEPTTTALLGGLTVKELKGLASASSIVGYSSMSKDELIQAIEVL